MDMRDGEERKKGEREGSVYRGAEYLATRSVGVLLSDCTHTSTEPDISHSISKTDHGSDCCEILHESTCFDEDM